MSTYTPYNPLAKDNLGQSVADALLKQEIVALGKLRNFKGAGIYAIYYEGNFDLYRQIADFNKDGQYALPIYVGKAIPKGARKGNVGLGTDPGQSLFTRLNYHAKSIGQAENLQVDDFKCRYLVVEDIWIPLGESLLIARFAPLWNQWVDGFGNHDPGKGRYEQERSRWDVLHPGRPFAKKCKARVETLDQIKTDIAARLSDMYD